jgi:hypothetical protein
VNLAGGFAAGEGADMLQQVLREKFAQSLAIKQQALQQQQLEEQRAFREAQQASLNDARAATQKTQAQAGATRIAGVLRRGSTVDPATKATLEAGDLGGLVEHKDATLGSTNYSGAVQGGQAPRIVGLAKTANPGQDAKDIYRGTGAQQQDQEQREARARMAATSTDPRVREYLNAEEAGVKLPSELLQPPKPTTQPILRVGRNGTVQQIGDAPTGAHLVNEPAPPRESNGLTPNQIANQTRAMRTDYTKIVAPARAMRQQLNYMDAGLNDARSGNLNAGSQAVLVTFQKILDPNSVVRESEYARSADGLGLMQRMQGVLPRLAQGGPGVPIAELEKFAALARQFTENAEEVARRNAEPILQTADDLGIDRKRIAAEERAQTPHAAGPQVASPTRVRYDMNGNPIKD